MYRYIKSCIKLHKRIEMKWCKSHDATNSKCKEGEQRWRVKFHKTLSRLQTTTLRENRKLNHTTFVGHKLTLILYTYVYSTTSHSKCDSSRFDSECS